VKQSKFLDSMGSIGILLVLLVLINIVADRFYFKVDITQESLYSLSNGTRNVLEKVPDEMHIKYFFTSEAEGAPIGLKAYGKRVKELLEEYVYLSGEKITLEVIDPRPDTEEEEWATKDGITGVPLPSGENFYMGCVVRPGNIAIPMFDPRRESFLEYDITEMIVRAMNPGKKKVGILSTLPVLGSKMQFQLPGQPAPTKDWGFVTQLKRNYDVLEVAKDTVQIPQIDVLYVMHPKNLSEQTQYAIDQYLMNGGRVVFMVDPVAMEDEGQGMYKASNADKLLKAYGVRFNSTALLADLENAVAVSAPNGGSMDYPVWLHLKKDAMNEDNVAVADLESVMFIEAGSVGLEPGTSVTFTPLIQTSKDASHIPSMEINRQDPYTIFQKVTRGNERQALVGLFTGKFNSAFTKAPEVEGEDKQSYSGEHLAQSSKENSIVVISDTDFLQNRFSVRELRMGPILLGMQQLNDNVSFIQNLTEFMLGDNDLISIRSRGKFTRPFTKVQDIQKAASEEYKAKEEELTKELERVQNEINKIQSDQVQGSKVILTQEQIAQIQSFREKERQIKRDRREVRKKLREDIEKLGQRITLLNLLLMPLLIGAFGFFRVLTLSNRGGR